jgi:hypothetical protein
VLAIFHINLIKPPTTTQAFGGGVRI